MRVHRKIKFYEGKQNMKFSRLFILLVAIVCVCTPVCSYSADQKDANSYIEQGTLPPQLLPPPPAEGTKEWQKQIAGVLAAQKHISDTDVAAIKDEQHIRLDLMISVMGSDFTREKLPKTFAFLDRVLANASAISRADKEYWHTRRPYLTDKRVKLYINRIDDNPAFPSGHTSEMRVLAEVLGQLRPEKLLDLRARAEEIALHRIEAGAHYPNDVEGGRLLAMLIVGALNANDDFQDDLEVAKKEIAGS
jgi:acid phosphatase (class A)